VLVAVATTPTAGLADAGRPCPATNDPRVVASGAQIVVYHHGIPSDPYAPVRFDACALRSRKRTRVVDAARDPVIATISPYGWEVRGRYVAFVAPFDDSHYHAFQLTLAVYDAVAGRRTTWITTWAGESPEQRVDSLAIGRQGAIAWIQRAPDAFVGDVYAFDRRGRRRIGTGAVPDSLSVRGATVRWRDRRGWHAYRLADRAPSCREKLPYGPEHCPVTQLPLTT
jgi:hypothetical protein